MFVGIFVIFGTYVLKIIRKIIHILNGNLKKTCNISKWNTV